MHSNLTRINKTVEICLELFLRTTVTTSCWELSNYSNKFASNLNMKGVGFLLTLFIKKKFILFLSTTLGPLELKMLLIVQMNCY